MVIRLSHFTYEFIVTRPFFSFVFYKDDYFFIKICTIKILNLVVYLYIKGQTSALRNVSSNPKFSDFPRYGWIFIGGRGVCLAIEC